MEGVLAAFAQFDNDVRADRTRAGMRAALEQGRWTFIPPLGYLNAPKWSGKSLAPDPDRAPLVTKLSTISRPVDLRVLRKLLTSPLRFQPVDGTWEFSGQAALRKILQGFVVPHRANSVASPAGFEPAFWS